MPGPVVAVKIRNSLEQAIRIGSSLGLDVEIEPGTTAEIVFPTEAASDVAVEISAPAPQAQGQK